MQENPKTCQKIKRRIFTNITCRHGMLVFSYPTLFDCLRALHIFCHTNLFVQASGTGIISSDAQSILGTSLSSGNCAPSLLILYMKGLNEWWIHPLVWGFWCVTRRPGSVFSFSFYVCGEGGGAAVVLKGRGDNWSWLFWCADNAIIRPNHIKGTLLGRQGPASYSQDIGNTPRLPSEHVVRSNKLPF